MIRVKAVCVIGPFPPPVHGAAEVTRHIADELENHVSVHRVSNAPTPGTVGMRYHASRIWRILKAAKDVIPIRGPIYLSAAGGKGLGYDIVLIILARLLRRPLFIHHHSFAYIDKTDWLARLLIKISGDNAVHVCLCATMASQLIRRYGNVRTQIVSNAAFLSAVKEESRKCRHPVKIGHLGNLSYEKGLDLVVDLASALEDLGIDNELILAGPSVNARSDEILRGARLSLGRRLKEMGPLYGAAKESFFTEVDIFVFPTRYINEAEPLVIFEALAHGLPIISVSRSCIDEQVGDAGVLARTDADFIGIASAAIVDWCRDPDAFNLLKEKAYRRMERLHAEAAQRLSEFCNSVAQSTSNVSSTIH